MESSIKDLGSTNGTWWQGTRVGEVVVPPGATIKFGETPVRIAASDAPSLPPSDRDHFGDVAGQSVAMRELFAVLEMAGPSDATVLIEGESGTGKELASPTRSTTSSARAAGAFVVVDCSAIAESLIDSHLFGHVRGAFTGADRDRKGAFVEASGGTLFLDELGELPLSAQAKLLRVLEAQTVQPVGADRPVKVDTRVVAATHRNLVADGRGQGVPLRLVLPARGGARRAAAAARSARGPAAPGRDVLSPAWPRARTDRWRQPRQAAALRVAGQRPRAAQRARARVGDVGAGRDISRSAGCGSITSAAAPQMSEVVDTSLPFKDAKERWNDQFERRYVALVFASNASNVTHAAEHAGLSRRHFRELLYKHGIIERPTDGSDAEG